jgi:CubicO group peptidase (beta-lactamase class C family)
MLNGLSCHACALLLASRLLAAMFAVVAAAPDLCAQNARPRTAAAARIDSFMTRAAGYRQFNGAILVVDRGRQVYERAFGEANMEWRVPNTLDTRFEIASMTKPMTAIMILQLVQEGKIRLDARVSEYLPFYPAETGARITVDQLLNHSSGLQQDIAFSNDPNDVPAIIAVINADQLSNDSLVKLIAARPLRFEPGSGYGYSSDAYAVLGAIIERVTGRSYWQALRERVLDPAGMSETGPSLLRPLVQKRAAGYAQTFGGYENAHHIAVTAAGGLYSTLRDLHRFDQALYGESLVKDQSKELLFALRPVITAYGWKTSEDTLPDGTRRRVLRTTGGLPGFGALMVRVPSARRTIILLTNTRDMVWRLDDFAVAIGRILDGLPYALPRQSAAEVIAEDARSGKSAIELRRRLDAMRASSDRFAVYEAELNRLGYHFLNARNDPARAIEIFQLNVRAFPKSANVYDSLAEAYLAHADTALAVINYRRSLELDPNNGNAAGILKRLAPSPR